jgi:hypothetical protein
MHQPAEFYPNQTVKSGNRNLASGYPGASMNTNPLQIQKIVGLKPRTHQSPLSRVYMLKIVIVA